MSDTSHQLKTPLAALNIYNGIVQDEGKNSPAIQKLSLLSEQELDRIEILVQSLLKITKLDTGTIILEKSLEHVSELAGGVRQYFLFRAQREGREICLSGSGETTFLRDRTRTIEAVNNLVKSAPDHTEKGSFVCIERRTFASVVQITIKDSGCGIHPEDLHRIFKWFYRSRFSKDTQGVGLGLPLTKAVVEVHSGTVEADNTSGIDISIAIDFLIPSKF